jgi:anti-sigma B factor antagonist
MALEIEFSTSNDRSLIVVRGEIDLYTSPDLRSEILAAVPKAAGQVAVHLSGVRYMDSSGVATLVEGLRSAREHGKSFTLVQPSPAVMNVLKLARLDSVFEVDQES